jgi:hypothetical protein
MAVADEVIEKRNSPVPRQTNARQMVGSVGGAHCAECCMLNVWRGEWQEGGVKQTRDTSHVHVKKHKKQHKPATNIFTYCSPKLSLWLLISHSPLLKFPIIVTTRPTTTTQDPSQKNHDTPWTSNRKMKPRQRSCKKGIRLIPLH